MWVWAMNVSAWLHKESSHTRRVVTSRGRRLDEGSSQAGGEMTSRWRLTQTAVVNGAGS